MDVLSCRGVSYGFVQDFHLSRPGWNSRPTVPRHSPCRPCSASSSSEALAEGWLLAVISFSAPLWRKGMQHAKENLAPACEKLTCCSHREVASLSRDRIDSGGIPNVATQWYDAPGHCFPFYSRDYHMLLSALHPWRPMNENAISCFVFLGLTLSKDI